MFCSTTFFFEVSIYNLMLVLSLQHSGSTAAHFTKSSPPPAHTLYCVEWHRMAPPSCSPGQYLLFGFLCPLSEAPPGVWQAGLWLFHLQPWPLSWAPLCLLVGHFVWIPCYNFPESRVGNKIHPITSPTGSFFLVVLSAHRMLACRPPDRN